MSSRSGDNPISSGSNAGGPAIMAAGESLRADRTSPTQLTRCVFQWQANECRNSTVQCNLV